MFLKRKISIKILIFFIFFLIFNFHSVRAAIPSTLQNKFDLLAIRIEELRYDLTFLGPRVKDLKTEQIERLRALLKTHQILITEFQSKLVNFFSPEKCLKLPSNVEQFDCINDLALLTGDERKCEIYYHPDFKFLSDTRIAHIETCYLFAAVGREDPSICKRLTTFPYSNESLCMDDYYTILAKEKEDISLCEKVQESTRQRDCIEHFIRFTGNLALCERIKDETYQNWCYRDYATSLEGCYKASDISRDFCIERLAIQYNNFSWCEKIEDEIIKNRCKRNF